MGLKDRDLFDEDSGGLARQFRTTARTLLTYAQARAQLFALESREASRVLGHRATYLAIGSALFFVGYCLFLAGLISVLSGKLGIHWHWISLALAGMHLIPGAILLMLLRQRFAQPLFEATLQEFDKDRTWLAPSKSKKKS